MFVRACQLDKRSPYYSSEQAGIRVTDIAIRKAGGGGLSEFTPKGQQQADLFAPSSAQSDALMAVIDQIKAKGLGRVGFASQGTGSPEWMMRQEHLSPCYTTRWEDLPVAR